LSYAHRCGQVWQGLPPLPDRSRISLQYLYLLI